MGWFGIIRARYDATVRVSRDGGMRLKLGKFILLTGACAMFAAVCWADGGDPKPIPEPGGGSTPITITNPNPVVTANAQPASEANDDCAGNGGYCVDDVFQNQTGETLLTITMFFSSAANPGLTFSCPTATEMEAAAFFDVCTAVAVAGGEDIIFSANGLNGYDGVAPATLDCGQYVGGEFAIVIFGTDVTDGLSITTQAITATPEPGVGLMVLFGAVAIGLLSLVRRSA